MKVYTEATMGCDSCDVLTIQGVACHEFGCESKWRDPVTDRGYPAPCWECGCEFIPDDKPNRYSICPDCIDGGAS